jgi:hypothetical protein
MMPITTSNSTNVNPRFVLEINMSVSSTFVAMSRAGVSRRSEAKDVCMTRAFRALLPGRSSERALGSAWSSSSHRADAA